MGARMQDIIAKKRDGMPLNATEISDVVNRFTAGEIPDYQMSAWLMAVYLRSMTIEETTVLTMAMAKSGRILDLSSVPGIKVDKHSTGGVGDTTTLIVAPLVAAAGVSVAKMSGRGLGFTGGTIDKLEAVPGFSAALSMEAFLEQLQRHHMAVIQQTVDLAPADGRIYALRDVTATVASIPLIASSIMSKKIAAGADKILLDVKFGNGAFMNHMQDAIMLAETMVNIGTNVGRETVAMITDMNEPLGCAVGNSLEIREAIDVLSGKCGGRLRELCLELGTRMLVMAGTAANYGAGQETLRRLLDEGAGSRKFAEFLAAQGGNPVVVENPDLLPSALYQYQIIADRAGFVRQVDTASIGYSAVLLGAGREKKGQQIDLSAGLVMQCRVGDYVVKHQPLAMIHANRTSTIQLVSPRIATAISIGDERPPAKPLIYGIVDCKGFQKN